MKLTRPGRRLLRRFKHEGVCLNLSYAGAHAQLPASAESGLSLFGEQFSHVHARPTMIR